MLLILELAGLGILAGGLLLLRRLARRAPARTVGHGRTSDVQFVLRVRHPGRARLLLGRGRVDGDTTVSVETVVVDDAEHRIQIPAGLRLTVRDFEVGEWVEDDAGPVLMLLPNGPFWILGAPAWSACAPIGSDGTRALPSRNYAITTTSPTTAVTIAMMDMPIWNASLGATDWILPPRAPSATPIVVMTFADPRGDDSEDRAQVVGGVALVLADELLRHCDAPVSTASAMIVGGSRVRYLELPTWPQLESWRSTLSGTHVIVRGEVAPDLEGGIRVVTRWTNENTEEVLEGSLAAVVERLVAFLHARGACTPVSPPPELRVPTPSLLAYQRAASLAFDSVLADGFNQAMSSIPGRAGAALEHARQLARSAPSSRVLRYLWASTAIRAHDADELPAEAWNEVLDRAEDPTDPLHLLSPLLLARLDFDGAEARRTELLAARARPYRDAPDPYLAWLQDLDLTPSDDDDDDDTATT